ncbi:beta-lactamase-like protein [Xylaria longipes]|nr:beta-lactamase-like protein [Xylaria longipes]
MVQQDQKKNKGGYRQINKTLNICAFEDYLESQQSHLPELPDVEQISPRVLRILGQNAGKFTLQGTNTYVIGTGEKRLLIDTGQGIPKWADLIASTLADSNITLSHVLLTHWHGDHTGGIPDLLRLYPSLASAIYKHTPGKGQQPIADGQVFTVEGATVRAVHAPGHSHDHMCFVLDEDNAMFTGDNVLGHGTAAVEQLSTWMASLRAMHTHNNTLGYPAHGAIVADLPAKIDAELASKTKREAQVLRALARADAHVGGAGKAKKTSLTVAQLVSLIHGDGLDEQVRTMAVEPFTLEVLRKLADDGMVAFEMRAGERRWFSLRAPGDDLLST